MQYIYYILNCHLVSVFCAFLRLEKNRGRTNGFAKTQEKAGNEDISGAGPPTVPP